MFSGFKYPGPYNDGIVSNVEIQLGWRDRLRILFGATIYLSVDTLCEFPPGRVESKTRISVKKPVSTKTVLAAEPLMKIGEVKTLCRQCDWYGTVYDCEPDVDGEGSLGCPECGAIVDESLKTKIGHLGNINGLGSDPDTI